jgi:glutathione S-transferase
VKGYHLDKNPRKKLPFIELNGRVITDSTIIIEHLTTHFEKDLDAGLTDQERAVSLSFIRLLEDHFYWTMVYYRWKYPLGWKQFKARMGYLPAPISIPKDNERRRE